MQLRGLHILLTYQCTYTCEHCFAWGSPEQTGVLTLAQLEIILDQALEAGVTTVYFEGGEPFLYYPILLQGVYIAAGMGFNVGLVSNAYWASTVADAVEWLRPMMGRLADFTVSSDLYHCSEAMGEKPQNALVAAKWLNIPTGLISVAQPEASEMDAEEAGTVMFRGRAAAELAPRAAHHPWQTFSSCENENLRDPGRLHLDPFGNLHICQGVVIGNLFERSLRDICAEYDPGHHPICGPLLAGGPAALVTEYGLSHEEAYADACHLCYEARLRLRAEFPEYLAPDPMYGVFS
jgi:MoaA/NifB/PqqE/SkfB family radical SAM enzyme